MPLQDFIQQYFIAPIQVEQGYNLANTLVYALIAFALLYLFINLFKHLKIKINFYFLFSLLPFIFIGSYIRTMVDSEIFQRHFLSVSPGIYLVVTVLFILTLLAGYFIQAKHKIPWWKPTFVIGIVLCLYFIAETQSRLNIENLNWLLLILVAWLFGMGALYLLLKQHKNSWGTAKLNFSAISSQLFDAINTSVILTYLGGVEKHPIPRYVIEKTGTAFSFIPLKLLVIIPAVYIIHTKVEDKEFRNLLLIAIAVLGLAQGLRNLLTMIVI